VAGVTAAVRTGPGERRVVEVLRSDKPEETLFVPPEGRMRSSLDPDGTRRWENVVTWRYGEQIAPPFDIRRDAKVSRGIVSFISSLRIGASSKSGHRGEGAAMRA